MENDLINAFDESDTDHTNPESDDTFNEELIPKRQNITDIPSFQTILCLIAALGMVIFNMAKPDDAEALLHLLKSLSADAPPIMGDPIGIIAELLAK